jgi:hypothetical protein
MQSQVLRAKTLFVDVFIQTRPGARSNIQLVFSWAPRLSSIVHLKGSVVRRESTSILKTTFFVSRSCFHQREICGNMYLENFLATANKYELHVFPQTL